MRLYAYYAPPSSLSLICPGWCAYTPITPHLRRSVYFVPGGALIRLLRPTLVAQFTLSRVVRLYAYYAPPSSQFTLSRVVRLYVRRSVYFVPGGALIRLLRPTLVAQFTFPAPHLRRSVYFVPGGALIRLLRPTLVAQFTFPGWSAYTPIAPPFVAQFNLSRVVRLYAYCAPPSSLSLLCGYGENNT